MPASSQDTRSRCGQARLPGAAHLRGGATPGGAGQGSSLRAFQPRLVTWTGRFIHLRWRCKTARGCAGVGNGSGKGRDPQRPLPSARLGLAHLRCGDHLDHGTVPIGGIADVGTRCQITRDAGSSGTWVWGCQQQQHPLTWSPPEANHTHAQPWLPSCTSQEKKSPRSFYPCVVLGQFLSNLGPSGGHSN